MGRDLYTRTVYGSALTLQTSTLAVIISLFLGSGIGVISGYNGGLIDGVLSRVIEVLMAVPSLLLSMAIITVLGFGTLNIALAVAVSSLATFARLSRGEVMKCKNFVFIEAARASRVRSYNIVIRHVLPHIASPIIALATLEFGIAILSVSALSFLGFGAPPPQPEWGQLVSEGRNYIVFAWWCTTLPGLVIACVVLATNQLSRSFQEYAGVNR